MKLKPLPFKVQQLLNVLNCPIHLYRHLLLVYNVGLNLSEQIQKEFPLLKLSNEEIEFGTSTHDIGKIIVINELYEKGKRHEEIGFKLLIESGIEENLARFTLSHGNWENYSKMEDLIVALSDKLWKGHRIETLEDKLISEVSKLINEDFWSVFLKMDTIFSKIIIGADQRIAWQKNDISFYRITNFTRLKFDFIT